MDFSSINWLAVLACLVASMIVGSIWFSPKTFFPAWWKAIGKSDKDQPSMASPAVTWGLTILAALVESIFMVLFVKAMGTMNPGGATLASGAMAGFLIWLGFVATTSLTNKLFAARLKAWLYEAGNHLVTMVIMGAIAGAFH
jgi:hypothetical protein